MLAFDPMSVAVVTTELIADRHVDGAVTVESSTQRVRHCAALCWNWRRVLAFTTHSNKNSLRLDYSYLNITNYRSFAAIFSAHNVGYNSILDKSQNWIQFVRQIQD